MSHQSSRLHRLLTLLDTGSTQATRLTAARQIGDIAKSHPQDLNSLLRKVSQYLRSKNWDTRVAAAHAIGAIAENVKHSSLSELFACVGKRMSEAGISGEVEDVVAWPDYHPKIMAGSPFRRCWSLVHYWHLGDRSMILQVIIPRIQGIDWLVRNKIFDVVWVWTCVSSSWMSMI